MQDVLTLVWVFWCMDVDADCVLCCGLNVPIWVEGSAVIGHVVLGGLVQMSHPNPCEEECRQYADSIGRPKSAVLFCSVCLFNACVCWYSHASLTAVMACMVLHVGQ